jgi:hypothetical protein
MFRVAVSGRKEQEASFFTVIVRDQAEPSLGNGDDDQGDPEPGSVASSISDATSGTRSMPAFRSVVSAGSQPAWTLTTLCREGPRSRSAVSPS